MENSIQTTSKQSLHVKLTASIKNRKALSQYSNKQPPTAVKHITEPRNKFY